METNSAVKSLLNRKDCLKIIRNDIPIKNKRYAYIHIRDFQIKKCSSDLLGFMGEYYRLEVDAFITGEVNIDLKRSYFVKTLPLNNPLYRNECERKGFFVKESAIYEHILPNIQRYIPGPLYPKAYLTRKDILVLEDFSSPGKGLKQIELHGSYTLKHYKLFLELLAQLHAGSLAWELDEGVNIGEKFKEVLYELQLTTKNEWYITGIKSILFLAQQHPNYQYPQALDFINNKLYNILLTMEDFTKPSQNWHNVLCHRDSWNRNIFWELVGENEPIGCRIVDFQLARYSPPAIDVLYFLYNNFETPQQRSELLKDLLDFYYQALGESLRRLNLPQNLITREEFDQDCERALLPILTLRAICEPLMKLPKGWSQTMREKEPETFDRYMNLDRSEMFKRVAALDATYMDKVFIPVQELLEYFDFKPK